ncbi:CAP domain-containing protein [Micromonosporaceae bacterium Da 78-11]
MRNFLRRFVLAAIIAPAAVGASMFASPAEAATAKASEQTLQADIITLTNVQRAAAGCAAVTADEQLTTAAREHSTWMAQTGTFSHVGSAGSSFVNRVEAAGFAHPASENIAWGYRTAAALVDAWMNSSEHRANMLNCSSTTVGVGAVYSAGGAPYYTQEFGY